MMRLANLLPALLLNASARLAQSTAMRFPQPVRAGSLLHRLVLRPVESQTVLGRVVQVVRDGTGTVELVIAYGGFLRIGSRPIAVPIDATVLLDTVMEIVAYRVFAAACAGRSLGLDHVLWRGSQQLFASSQPLLARVYALSS